MKRKVSIFVFVLVVSFLLVGTGSAISVPVSVIRSSALVYRSDFLNDAAIYVSNVEYGNHVLSIAAVNKASQHKNEYYGNYAKLGVYTSRRIEVDEGFYAIDLSVDKEIDDPKTRVIVDVSVSRDGETWSDSVSTEDAAAHITFKSTSLSEEPYHYVFYQIVFVAYDEKDEGVIHEIKMDFGSLDDGPAFLEVYAAKKEFLESQLLALDGYYEKVELAGLEYDQSIIDRLEAQVKEASAALEQLELERLRVIGYR
ncbi:MAG: hypothetical protein LBK75_11735 [Oscillospiraceae bacterium]|nr:hypothetical protein [Oscillospiraceae bacterium]